MSTPHYPGEHRPPAREQSFVASDAQEQADRVAAETLIRTTVMAMANGAAVKDLDGIVQRNIGNITMADLRSGRLGSMVIGDIINSVEKAKASAPFNWSAATPEQIKAYLSSKGISLAGYTDRVHSGEKGDASSRKGGDADVRGLTAASYGGTSFAATGLGYDAFNAMRKEGFNASQITAAVDTNKALGLGANDNPAATARLQRDTPWAVRDLQHRRSEMMDIHQREQRAKEAAARGDHAEAARLRKENEKKHEEHEKKRQQARERLHRENPGRARDYDDKYREIENSIKAMSKNEQEAKARLATLEKYRRNPHDAQARRDYAELKQELGMKQGDRKMMAKIDKTLDQGHKAEVAVAQSNEVSGAENADMFASLTNGSTQSKPAASNLTESGPRETSATDPKPPESKLADVKATENNPSTKQAPNTEPAKNSDNKPVKTADATPTKKPVSAKSPAFTA